MRKQGQKDMRARPATTVKNARNMLAVGTLALGLTGLTGCHLDMWRQNKLHNPQQPSPQLANGPLFEDGSATRLPVAGTVARGQLKEDVELHYGVRADNTNQFVTDFPITVDRKLLTRGRERFNIYCSPCHGQLGDGNGMIAQRGFALRRPPGNYHTERLRNMPVGHFYDVITNGFGTMYSYASRIQDPRDRWAIVAWIRVLQRSQGLVDVQAAGRRFNSAPSPGQIGDPTQGQEGNMERAPSGDVNTPPQGEGTLNPAERPTQPNATNPIPSGGGNVQMPGGETR